MPRRRGNAFFKYGAAVIVLVLAAAVAAALLIPTDRRLGRRPGWDVMPDTWFARPNRVTPSQWKRVGPRLTLSVAAARVHVVPEDRADIAVEAAAPLKVVQAGADVTVSDGSPPPRRFFPRPCGPTPAGAPVVTVHAPKTLEVVVDHGAVDGDVGPTRGLQLVSAGCGLWRAGAAEDLLNLAQSGPGAIEAGGARLARVRIEGPGRIALGHVSDGLDVYLDGKGQASTLGVDGRLDVELWGAGSVQVEGGITHDAYLFAKGRGRIRHGGSVANLTAEARGRSVIEVGVVTGLVTGLEKDDAKISYARPAGRRFCRGAFCD